MSQHFQAGIVAFFGGLATMDRHVTLTQSVVVVIVATLIAAVILLAGRVR